MSFALDITLGRYHLDRVFVLGLAVLALLACSDEPVADDGQSAGAAPRFTGEVMAEVHGQPIVEDLLLSYLQIRGLNNPTEEQRQQALNSLIDLFLLEHEARQSGMLERRAFQARMKVQQLSWTANQILAEFANNKPMPKYSKPTNLRSAIEARWNTACAIFC